MPCLFISNKQSGLSSLLNKLSTIKANHIFTITQYRNIKIYRINGNILYSDLMQYLQYDVLVIAFSVTNWSTFNSIRAYAVESIYTIVVGLKTDLRDEQSVSYEEGWRRAREMGAEYVEVSIYSERSIDELFDRIERRSKVYYCCYLIDYICLLA